VKKKIEKKLANMQRSYRNTQPQTTPQRQTRQTQPTTNYVSTGYQSIQTPQVQVQAQVKPPVQTTPVKPLQQQAPVQQVPKPMEVIPANGADNGGGDENVKIVRFQARGRISAKQRRARANRRLRKLLCPKTAVMALHELRNKDVELEFKVSDTPVNGQFKADTVFEGKLYTGFGPGKQAARNNVAEKILRDMVIERMKKFPKKEKTEKKEGNESGDTDIEMPDATTEEEEEVPMTHLASYALHKLFAEWAKEGYEVPDFRTPIQIPEGVPKPPINTPPKARIDLPANAEKTHPAMLLQVMRPGIQYQELGSEGTTPNVVHAIGVTVDEQQFIGSGKSKKIARKEAARHACEALFQVKFAPEA
jgi:hypothetical protein